MKFGKFVLNEINHLRNILILLATILKVDFGNIKLLKYAVISYSFIPVKGPKLTYKECLTFTLYIILMYL